MTPPGDPADRFLLEARLGAGAHGEVWRAWDALLERHVALKRLHAANGDVEALRAEFRTAAALRHPAIAEVFDLLLHPGAAPCFTLELLDALPFDAACADLPPRDVLALGAQAFAALAHLEAHGLVHGDLKPSNLLVTGPDRRALKLVDFGLARAVPGAGLQGTPAYLAPEVISRGRRGPASERYALGVILYEALTGTHPFRGVDTADTLGRHLEHAPPPAHHLRPALEPAVGAFLARLLDKAPEGRFASWAEARDALVALTASDAVAAAHARAPSLATPPLVGRDDALMGVVFALAQLGSGAGTALIFVGPEGRGKSRMAAAARLYAEVDARPTAATRLRGLPDDAERVRAAARCARFEPRPEGRAAPAVVIVDDAHRAHPSAVAALAALIEASAHHPLLLALTATPAGAAHGPLAAPLADAFQRGHALRFDLRALAPDESHELLAGALGEPIDAAHLGRPLHEASAGEPGRLVPLLEQLAASGRLRAHAAGWALDAAPGAQGAESLASAYAGRVAASPPEQRALWSALGMLGEATRDDLAALLDLDPPALHDRLERAVADRSVDRRRGEDGRERYCVAAIGLASAAIDGLNLYSRRDLAQRAWVTLQRSNEPRGPALDRRLARIALAAGARTDAGVVVPRAAAAAEAAGDLGGALGLWRELATLGCDADREVRAAWSAVARLACRAGRYAEVLEALDAARAWGPPPGPDAASLEGRLHSEALARLGRPDEAREEAWASWRASAALGTATARGHAALAVARALRLAGDAPGAREVAREAVAPGLDALGDAALASALLREIATLDWQGGHAERALEGAREALAWAERTADAREVGEAAMTLGTALRTAGRSEDAVAHYERATAQFRACGALASLGKAHNNVAVCHYLGGRIEAAAGAWREALSVAEWSGEREEQLILLNNLGYMYLERGALALAEQSFEEALRRAEGEPASALRLSVLGNLAQARLEAGRTVEARGPLDEALALAQALGARGDLVENRRRLAEWHLATGEAGEALRVARSSAAEAHKLGLAREEAHLLRVMGLAELRRGALVAAEIALTRAAALGALAEGSADGLRLTLAQAELALARGEVGHARAEVAAAIAGLTALGAGPLLDEARKLEARIGATGGPERAAGAEADVLALAIDALSACEGPVDAAEGALHLALAASGAEHGTVFVTATAVHDAVRVSASGPGGETPLDPDVGQYSRTVARRVLESGASVALHRVEDDALVASAESVVALQLRSILCVAVPIDGRPAGLLYLDSRVHVGDRFRRAQATVERLARLLGGAVERLRLRERLATQAGVLSVITHELRSPLTAILGFGELAAAHTAQSDPKTHHLVTVSVAEAQRMQRLLEDVQALGRAWQFTVDRAEPVAPRALLDSAADRVVPATGAIGVRVVVATEPALPQVLADAGRVQQVLGNLLENALRYSHPGSAIALSAAREPFLGAVGERRMVRFTVEDEGPGITPEDAERIFERFHRGSAPRGAGSGLGLSIAQSIVLAHGGRLWAVAQRPKGRLCFTLPAHVLEP